MQQNRNKTLFVLVGPAGSGKSYVGDLLQKKLDIRFLPVELYFREAKGPKDEFDDSYFAEAWNLVEKRVDDYLRQHNQAIIDSLGTFPAFKKFLARLILKYQVKLVQVKATGALCQERVKKRDKANHVAMKPGALKKVNEMVMKENHKYDVVIDNCKSTDEEIIKTFKELTRRTRMYSFR